MTRITRSLLAALLLAAPLSLASAQAAGAPSVAIVFPDRNVVVKGAPGSDHFNTALAALIGYELSSNYAVRVADRAAVHRLSGTTPVSREMAIRVGAIVGAQHALYGSFSADEAVNIRADVHGVNVIAGTVEFTDRVQGPSEGVLELVHRLTEHLARGVHLVPLATAHVPPMVPESVPLKTILLYGQGLDMADRGDRAGATAALENVLKDFPAFRPARIALDSLK